MLDTEDFAYPPSGGKIKLILLGIIIPAFIMYYGISAWCTEQAYWPGRRGGITVRGDTARAMAVVYMSIASFMNSRWYWGLIHFDKVFRVGMVLSMLTFVGALLWALTTT